MRTLAVLFLVVALGVPCAAAGPVKATGSVELKDAAGDLRPMGSSDGEEPPLDIVLLKVTGTGNRLTVTVTLKDAPGNFASDVVRIYLDTDNNPKTGVALVGGDKPTGFEYQAGLYLCMSYDSGGSACSGGLSGKVTERHGSIELSRFKGTDNFGEKETVVDNMGFGGRKASAKVPVQGKTVECWVDYADLKVKPGATIRFLAVERGGSPKEGDGFFPEVLLTLK